VRELADRESLTIGLQILLWFSLNLLLLCLVGSLLFYSDLRGAFEVPRLGPLPRSCWISAGLLTGSVILWIPLFRRITRPIRRMQRAAHAMARGHFQVRVPVERRDELGSLALSLNELAARLENIVASKHQFLADTAHELSSPLARMEWALSIAESRDCPQMKAALQDIREEVTQMSQLLQDLLHFARDKSSTKSSLQPVCLSALIGSALRQEAVQPEDVDSRNLLEALVLANHALLQRAVANVVRNARRHAPGTGPIYVESERSAGRILLRITDQGSGVAPEDLPKLTEPFFRPESARARHTGGLGLGLSIVKRCVEACAGTLRIFNAPPRGLCVEISLREVVTSPNPGSSASI
jgi:two-component system sensor histidine kinase CpxA